MSKTSSAVLLLVANVSRSRQNWNVFKEVWSKRPVVHCIKKNNTANLYT